MKFETVATILFGLAVVHTFLVKVFQRIALRYPSGSVGENFFHMLGEVEIVFGAWAGILCLAMALGVGDISPVTYLESLNFTEPLFVFTVMAISATRPILRLTEILIVAVSKAVPIPNHLSFYLVILIAGPLLGSFITEPAAMAVTAILLQQAYFKRSVSLRFKYISLGTLFVNVSVGGTLTHFAAPPVVMVANKWGWDTTFMLSHFGWKAVLAVVASTVIAALLLRSEFKLLKQVDFTHKDELPVPIWLKVIHVLFLLLIIRTSHHPVVFAGIFLFFLGMAAITKEYQDEIKLKEALLVGFFLGGLVVLGAPQKWWLEPVLSSLGEGAMFIATTLLTAVTDNAALTYLGAQVSGLSDAAKYALVAGSVTGGGLTVIANAPNPIGFSILRDDFGPEGIGPLGLLKAALIPTAIAALCFWFL